jgi:hypothetical protein
MRQLLRKCVRPVSFFLEKGLTEASLQTRRKTNSAKAVTFVTLARFGVDFMKIHCVSNLRGKNITITKNTFPRIEY